MIPLAVVRTSMTCLIRLRSERNAELSVSEGRSSAAACSKLSHLSAALTAASTSFKVPGKRQAKKSGRRLMLARALGQYYLAIRQYSGNFLD